MEILKNESLETISGGITKKEAVIIKVETVVGSGILATIGVLSVGGVKFTHDVCKECDDLDKPIKSMENFELGLERAANISPYKQLVTKTAVAILKETHPERFQH